MVAPTAHITLQNFLIGSFPEIEFFHWLRECCQYLHPYMISHYKIFTMHAPYRYIHVMHLTFLWKNLQAYNIQDRRSYMGQQTDLSLPLYIYNFLSIHNRCTNKYTIVFSFTRATDWYKKCTVSIFLDDFPIPQIGHVPLSERSTDLSPFQKLWESMKEVN